VNVAVVNGPRSVVVSGEPDALDEFVEKMNAEGTQARRISVDYASHSHQVTRLRDRVVKALLGLSQKTSTLPFYSTLYGGVIDTAELNGTYWYNNLREKVLFESSVRRLVDDGFRVFIEMSPHPVLTVPVQEMVEELDDAVVLSSARRDHGEVESVVGSLAQLHVRGGAVDWGALFGVRQRVDLPTYAFQRQRYWLYSSHEVHPPGAPPTELPAGDDETVRLPDMVSGLPDDEATALVLDHVLEKIAAVLGHSSSETVDPDQEFRNLGFDSLLAVELTKRLAATTGVKLRANLVLQHPTPRLVAGHIMTSIADRELR
jgi:acyl transferase domain-containing protein